MIELEITEEMRDKAARVYDIMTEDLIKRYEKDAADTLYIGKLGDVVFEDYLIKNGFRRNVDYETVEGTRSWDFKFRSSGITVDVRAARFGVLCGQPDSSWYFGYSVDEKPEMKDYIVICYINTDYEKGTIAGFIPGKHVIKYRKTSYNSKWGYEYKNEVYDIPLRDVKEIHELLSVLKPGTVPKIVSKKVRFREYAESLKKKRVSGEEYRRLVKDWLEKEEGV